ncbi:thiamine pyrophosphate-binding protein [Cellulomonas xiejunii]|uniref:Thiamine pyrophosphate-binding protein n=1 Tax=Cellulomonas xiejunii TaxID=2968083 RepID=A0ABY5KJN9_9CELL|nr:thiamine pyrophosphate-binding protein [Cellulomonas xiejunii]MCC2312908.1 thiamine pyrophosphate-binding protein [Cellulomonas xiejunii]MCC2320222.1 thiamine pyrophosphate-binding protein [Cellulomonas xiejunii]UUI70529.1 thiamine pyrophosphate-binding protein [Cellulomonas xiejunii]
MKYSDLTMTWLRELGYTHCFFVAGGNSMHLLDGARQVMTCVPVVHEVAAGIAVEYFNEQARADGSPDRAFALVTAGPGLTNLLTAVAGAYLESRELLVIGGQVKSTDIAGGAVRQRGIQEIDGVSMAAPVCVAAERLDVPVARSHFTDLVLRGSTGRPGPVLIEMCLDVQGAPVEPADLEDAVVEPTPAAPAVQEGDVAAVVDALRASRRPVLLLGGGVSREAVRRALPRLHELDLPVMTTWNGADRLGADDRVYAGRPNTWGQRSANVLLQQADLVLAVGTRLGLQQTGFNWQQFAPLAVVAQVDIDVAELKKGHPRVDIPWHADADEALEHVLAADLPAWTPWLEECREVRALLPIAEESNVTAPGYADPYRFVQGLAARCASDDVVIPCSSGGAFTVTLQAFEQKSGQTMISDHGLASMGYGLSGAIGAAIAAGGRRTVLLEGDGGFMQNSQELATVAVRDLPVKIFLFSNEGYASIRMTQKGYFGGAYLGCDTRTGLGFPDWDLLFRSYGIPLLELDASGVGTPGFDELFDAPGPAAFVVPIDPEQTYFPKITSRVTASGSMESNPLHLMSPELPAEMASRVLRHLSTNEKELSR